MIHKTSFLPGEIKNPDTAASAASTLSSPLLSSVRCTEKYLQHSKRRRRRRAPPFSESIKSTIIAVLPSLLSSPSFFVESHLDMRGKRRGRRCMTESECVCLTDEIPLVPSSDLLERRAKLTPPSVRLSVLQKGASPPSAPPFTHSLSEEESRSGGGVADRRTRTGGNWRGGED